MPSYSAYISMNFMHNLSRPWILGLSLLLMNVTGNGCQKANVYQAPPPPDVMVALPIQKSVTSYIEQTGKAQASERVELKARIEGFIQEIHFTDGDRVKTGQLLFVIEEKPFKVKLEHARAKVNEADANLKKAQQSKEREIAQAQLQLSESEHKLAAFNFDRVAKLLEKNALTQQEHDQIEVTLRTSEARVTARKAEYEQAQVNFQSNIATAQATLDLAKADAETAAIDLGYCRITAPIDGMIDRRTVDVGNYLADSNDNALATIVRTDPIYAYASVNEAEYLRVKNRYLKNNQTRKDIPVMMGIGEDRTFPFQGEIDYVSPTVQADTGTVQIRGVFKNTNLVMPGMFIRLRVPTGESPDALLVSERSLGYDQAGIYVYVVNAENTIERRNVVAGDVVDGNRVIVGEIKADDKVVADGLLKIRPGMKVNPKFPEPKPTTPVAADDHAATVTER